MLATIGTVALNNSPGPGIPEVWKHLFYDIISVLNWVLDNVAQTDEFPGQQGSSNSNLPPEGWIIREDDRMLRTSNAFHSNQKQLTCTLKSPPGTSKSLSLGPVIGVMLFYPTHR